MDPVKLEVIYRATVQIIAELSYNMMKTGYSTIIKESKDFSFAIFDADARVIAQYLDQPVQVGAIEAQVMEVHRRGGGEEGDAFIVNHPYQACCNHATDIALISPIFYRGKRVAYVGNTAHKQDIGGLVPATNCGASTSLFHEGLLIPPVKLYERGKLNEGLRDVIRANSRTPEIIWGDVQAQAQTNFYGAKKIVELMGKYSLKDVTGCWSEWKEICEREIRKEISKVQDGTYGPVEDYIDDDGNQIGKPLRISISMEKKGDEIHFYLESSEQAKGPINLRPCVAQAVIKYCVRSAFGPDLPGNEGIMRPVKISFPPEGSLLNPKFPAPVNMYARASQLLESIIMRVLAEIVPERVPAPASGSGGSIAVSGNDPARGRWFTQFEILSGGYGALPDKDGIGGMDCGVTNTMNSPVEALESEFPVMLNRYELIPDSGGAGRFRGGLGVSREWKIMGDQVIFNLRTDRFKHSSPGIFGSKKARPARAFLNPGTPDMVELPSKVTALELKRGDVFRWELGGGGGRGDPLERNSERVLEDVINGYVSLEGAKKDYGVVIDPEYMRVDFEKTQQLREQLRGEEKKVL